METMTARRRNIISYMASLIKAGTFDSSKSFSLVLSAIVGALTGLCVCFCIIYDVCKNSCIKTDLDSLGVFMLCVGGYMAGGGLSKVISEKRKNGTSNNETKGEQS